jgi:hypothetical protein
MRPHLIANLRWNYVDNALLPHKERFLFKIFCKIYIVIVWTSGLIFLTNLLEYIKVKSARIGKFYNIIL